MKYLQARLQERSTAFGLASIGISAVCLIFPEYAVLINQIGLALGVGAASLPTGGQSK